MFIQRVIARKATLTSKLQRNVLQVSFARGCKPLVDSKFYSSSASNYQSSTPPESPPTPILAPQGKETLLYEGNSEVVIRVMFGTSIFNLMYWTAHLATSVWWKGVVVNGVELGGDPMWAGFGFIGTGLMFFSTRQYAIHTTRRAYLSEDGQRLGFQMYNVHGSLGRKIEVSLHNARLAIFNDGGNDNRGLINRMSSSLIPCRVEGINSNILLDRTGTFYENGKLMQIMEANTEAKKSMIAMGSAANATGQPAESKQARIEALQKLKKVKGKKV